MRLARAIAAACAGTVAALLVAAPAHAETVRQAEWYLDALHVPEAQQITRGDGVIVAVVESDGVDGNHPDLAGQVLPGYGANNGWGDTKDDEHATVMASIIAAKGGGDTHALGIAPGARILPVRLPPGNRGPDVGTGVRWAVDHGAKVVNLSIGGVGAPSPEEVSAVAYALAHNVVVVAAAGNVSESGPTVTGTGSVPGEVTVSGVDRTGALWSGSAHGPQVAIGAPAVDIVTAAPPAADPGGYAQSDGTSDATAIVSGTVALIRAKFPNLDANNVIQRLIATARDQPPAGRDDSTGYGTVRVLDALTKDVPAVSTNPLGTPDASGGGTTPSETSTGGTSGGKSLVIFGLIGLGILVVIVIVVVIVVAANRPKRAATPMARPGPYPPPGAPPRGAPPTGAPPGRPGPYPPAGPPPAGPPPGGRYPPSR